jgi:hypothetical protein
MPVTGGVELRALAARLHAADKALIPQLRKEIKAAVDPIPTAIRAEIPRTMPSGYAPVLSRSLRTRISTRVTAGDIKVTLTAYADGKTKRREVGPLNRGVLRHTRWGDRRHWYAQAVQAGFWSRPIEAGLDDVKAAAARALEKIANIAAGG